MSTPPVRQKAARSETERFHNGDTPYREAVNVSLDDPFHIYGPEVHEILQRVTRMAASGAALRLVLRFDILDGLLGVRVGLDRLYRGRWTAEGRPEWLPFDGPPAVHLFANLVHLAEHGRLLDSSTATGEGR